MGRSRIYHTPEAKLAANRAKSKKYYHKLKDTINEKRRQKYQLKYPRLDAQSSQSADTSVKNTTEVFDPLATWMEHTDRLARRLSGITNGQSAVLVDSLCRQYMLDFDSEPLDTTLCRLGRILESLSRCQNEVLQLAGVGHHLEAVNVSLKEVRVLIGWIDEILCVAMVEKNDVIKMHGEKGFMFQGK